MADQLQKLVLEDFLNDYFQKNVVEIRKTKKVLLMPDDTSPDSSLAVEHNVAFIMEYFASVGCCVPNMKVHKMVLSLLGSRYAIHTKSRALKEWVKTEAPNIRCILVHALLLCKRAESSRSQKIRFLKQFIHKLMTDEGQEPEQTIDAALTATAANSGSSSEELGDSPSPRGEAAIVKQDPLVNPDAMDTLPLDIDYVGADAGFVDGARRQAAKDHTPLEAVPPELTEKDVNLLGDVEEGDKDEMADVYGKQLASVKTAKIQSAQALVDKANGNGKVIKNLKEGRGKGKGRGRGKRAAPTPDAPDAPDAPDVPNTPDESEKASQASPAAEASSKKGSEDLKQLWKEKEKELRALPIQIPSNIAEKKSFTIKPPQDSSGTSTIGILWTLDQIYVTKVIKECEDVKTNKKGGATISIRRRGGWVPSYELAEKLAGWL